MSAAFITVPQVEALAPDPAALEAAQRLAAARHWGALGHTERAVWGDCRGGAVYRVRVALPELEASCTCPSRKVPCKHALALLLLCATAPESVPQSPSGSEPEWVTSWVEGKAATQRRRVARAARSADQTPDREAQAKRANRRQANVLAGIEQLEIWMADLVRHGLGRLPGEGPELWDTQARRLVDAQAPGLASRVRSTGHRVGVGDEWPERVLGDLGRLALLTRAYRRLDSLPPPLQEDVRRWVGFTLDKEEVLARGETLEDEWIVASVSVIDDEPLRLRRTWLVGRASARTALILDAAHGSTPFQQTFLVASAFRARLVFWPSAHPERALLAERLSATSRNQRPPHACSIGAALEHYAAGLARDPWLERTLLVLDSVVIARDERGAWYAIDTAGDALRLRGGSHEVLFALSGGHPLCLAGEWNGFVYDPLVAYPEGRAVLVKAEVE